ncbi:hypothetical protein [Herbidospora cretacea]|uniref:hypothetical protein n=1 Tax=Herbidospora cretacea TaxID=28444 RepID=UPI0004C3D73B|nr:hypothetical protein [Herbidospora cretacea]
MRHLLAFVLLLAIGGCHMWSEEEPVIAEAIADLDAALTRAVQAAGLPGDVARKPRPHPCHSETRHGAGVDIDGASEEPAKTVAAVLASWRREGLTVVSDQTGDQKWPQATVRGRLIEMTITGFPDRKAVWIWGSAACLEGEVPDSWRSVL